MGMFGRGRRDSALPAGEEAGDREASKDAEQVLGEAVDAYRRVRDEARAQVKSARSSFDTAVKQYDKAISSAERDLQTATQDEEIARRANVGRGTFGAMLSDPDMVGLASAVKAAAVLRRASIRTGNQEHALTPDVKASVETEGNLATKSRTTLTRVGFGTLLAGPAGMIAGAAAQKSSTLDVRKLYLLIEAEDWAWVHECNPEQSQQARDFAQKVNVAARMSTASSSRQSQATAALRRRVDAAGDDRASITAAATAVKDAQAKAVAETEPLCAAVRTAMSACDSSSRAVKRAQREIDEPVLSKKLAALPQLPAPPNPWKRADRAQQVLPNGSTAEEALVSLVKSTLGLMARAGKGDAQRNLVQALRADEAPIVVAAGSRKMEAGLLVLTSDRVLFGTSNEVTQFELDSILSMDAGGGFTGGSIKLKTIAGEEFKVGGIDPEGRAEEIVEAQSRMMVSRAPIAETSEPSPDEVTPNRPLTSGDPLAVQQSGSDDVLDQIRKLGELRDAGVLTGEEFDAKKAELLGRL